MMKLNFAKDAGVKLSDGATVNAIVDHLKGHNLISNGIEAELNGATLVLTGEAENVVEKNKVLATAGNIQGIEAVEDRMTLKGQGTTAGTTSSFAQEAAEVQAEIDKQFYTVKKGDYLSKIAKEVYGNANKYPVIFEANKPMLKDPDLIYPGQVLVIPALEN